MNFKEDIKLFYQEFYDCLNHEKFIEEYQKTVKQNIEQSNRWLIHEINRGINDNDFHILGRVTDFIRNFYPNHEEPIALILSKFMCSIIVDVIENVQFDNKIRANLKFFLIWEIADIMFENPKLYEVNEEEVSRVLGKVCVFNYKKEQWIDENSNDEYSQFYIAVFKSLCVLIIINNATSRHIIETCKSHFDSRIAEQAMEA
jgi:hypothetical protein